MSKIKTVTIANSNKMELKVSNFGATILSLLVPDRNSNLVDVVVGLESDKSYTEVPYTNNFLSFGSSVGRYAGRLSNGGFKIDDIEYPIYTLEGVHLHGGNKGFNKKYWEIEEVNNEGESPSVTLSYFSPHLEEGYPGNLKVFVTYELSNSNVLKITYKATTDKKTHVNLTNHSYFNLNGTESILDHELIINSNQVLEVDDKLIPTGELINISNTRYDFNNQSRIGREIFIGLDDAFVLNKEKSKIAAELYSDKTGIKMEVFTNQLAVVVFTHPEFPELPFRKGSNYSNFPAICFEAQNFADAPNKPNFPTTILTPEDTYLNESVFKFSS